MVYLHVLKTEQHCTFHIALISGSSERRDLELISIDFMQLI